MKYKFSGFLFDMDGTLVDSSSVVESTWLSFSDKYGFLYDDVLRFSQGRRTRETVFHFLGRTIDSINVAEEIEVSEISKIEGITQINGANSILNCIDEKHWGVVTSANRKLAMSRLKAAGLPTPRIIISSEDVENGKPSPEGYLKGANALGMNIRDMLIFEDAPAGIQAACSSGAQLIVIGECREANGKELRRIKDFREVTIYKTNIGYSVE